ncbi:MAG: flagellar biosynthetic protein FliR [Legionellales bacterium]|nr:flagellar biosynthetic protein FliR [Legionellales bacterium]
MQEYLILMLTLLPTFFLALVRVSSFIFASPFFSNTAIPARIRALLSLLITVVILPFIPPIQDLNLASIDGFILISEQIILGLAVGFTLRVVFEILILSGQIIAYQTGLGFATIINPLSDISVPMVSQIYILATTLIFIALNGHLMIIKLLASSFHTIPLTNSGLSALQFETLINFTKILYASAVSISLPAIISILVVNFAFAVMTSTAPQLNIFNIGFPITLIMGLFIIYVSFSGVMDHSQELIQESFTTVNILLHR